MAVGTVSASNTDDIWQLIATNSPSSATSSTFSSISGYKKLMLVFQLTCGSNARYFVRFNSDSTATNYGGMSLLWASLGGARPDDRLMMTAYPDTSTVGYVVFNDTDKTTPKFIEKFGGQSTGTLNGIYLGTAAVSSITIAENDGGYAFSGTIKLYGVAA